jgi:hypothetical protein
MVGAHAVAERAARLEQAEGAQLERLTAELHAVYSLR